MKGFEKGLKVLNILLMESRQSVTEPEAVYIYLTLTEMGEVLGVSRKTVARYMKSFVELGLISCEQHGRWRVNTVLVKKYKPMLLKA